VKVVGYWNIYFREIMWGGVGWMHLVQDGERWRALVNVIMNDF
jgi:hypothetical protein